MIIPFGESVGLIARRVIGRDENGNDLFSSPDPVMYEHVPVWPVDGNGSALNEILNASDLTTYGIVAAFPAGTDVIPTDRVIVRGVTWEVSGSAPEYVSPFTGWAPGVVVALRRWTG